MNPAAAPRPIYRNEESRGPILRGTPCNWCAVNEATILHTIDNGRRQVTEGICGACGAVDGATRYEVGAKATGATEGGPQR